MMEQPLVVGSRWQENDPRFSRTVRIEAVGPTVFRYEDEEGQSKNKDVPMGKVLISSEHKGLRFTLASIGRFTGKSRGYRQI